MWAPQRLRGAESACSEVAAGEAGSVPGWEDPLEEGVAAASSVLACGISRAEKPAGWATVHRVAESWSQLK